ncbi:DUF1501 domain-containing protein [Paenibacillus chartarius]|uniref:DUF1501 domain-containing protein n=1 Tax=Paenibacillus chartarius TaxID=747481 RepID=A0ABV6DUI3_9BACL
MKLSRREFLLLSGVFVGSMVIGGPLLHEGVRQVKNGLGGRRERALVVVQLSGGNDGINTVIPYGQGAYYDERPTLRIAEKEVLQIDGRLGFHPSLTGLHDLYREGKLAVVQGTGYPKPSHSHFRSMEIWHTAEPEQIIASGWLGRYLQAAGTNNPLHALQIGGTESKAFFAPGVQVPVMQSLETFTFLDQRATASQTEKRYVEEALRLMYESQKQPEAYRSAAAKGQHAYEAVQAMQALLASGSQPGQGGAGAAAYPEHSFARELRLAASLLDGGTGTRVFYVQLGGFDDHANEREQHARMLGILDKGLSAFYKDLKARGLSNDVVTVVFSEFGRRVRENQSGGTDHGTAGPVLVLGGKVKGGLYGQYPSLTQLTNGDLRYEVDFRSVYSTLLEDWLRVDSTEVLGRKYESLRFV